MFEISVALKYLLPRWRQLSVSIISLISVFVIALVVWLIVVFFSVTHGLEKSWIQKLIALTSPIRITPTEKYYESFYYQVDSISSESDYSYKSIGEKLSSLESNPYRPEIDQEIPSDWPSQDLTPGGALKDPVKLAFQSISEIDGVICSDFEMAAGTLNLRLVRKDPANGDVIQSVIKQAVYLGSYDSSNSNLPRSILPPSQTDLDNVIQLAGETKASDLIAFNHANRASLPSDQMLGDAVLIPKTFKEAGVRIGDKGHLAYFTPTPSTVQEQQVPVYVAGFYDPGIFPLGGRFLVANKEIASLIRSSQDASHNSQSNGIHVRFNNLNQAEMVKARLSESFKKRGIDQYWNIETFREFDFTKDLLQQLKSEKNLFMIIATVIIIVACSNIISMLIILVNDKKTEIGILRTMGASSRSIASIFGLCGFAMGFFGSLLGIITALFTLKNLDSLIALLSRLQGFDAFNPMFYGETLPNEVSIPALVFVLLATALISLIAGIVPAVKASLIQPSTILRSE